MRLTLRTLLSWMDDTLQPEEARRIGLQVEESEVARELVDRIRRVTRQRRLTVPPSSGPESSDPNQVAEYLDNAMATGEVPEFERTCLKSDVHLAEVAGSHQILSLIGQRAKVPNDARYRMYHLLPGESQEPTRVRTDHRMVSAEPVSESLGWSNGSRKPSTGRNLRPMLAAGLLLPLLAWSTWHNLSQGPIPTNESVVDLHSLAAKAAPGVGGLPAAGQLQGPAAVPAPPIQTALNQPPGITPNAEPATGTAVANTNVTDSPKMSATGESGMPEAAGPTTVDLTAQARAAAAAGHEAGLAQGNRIVQLAKSSGIVLGRGPKQEGPWTRLEPGNQNLLGHTLINLAPYRSEVTFGSHRLNLIGGSSIRFDEFDKSGHPQLHLERGQLLVQSGKTPLQLTLKDQATSFAVLLSADSSLGVERGTNWQPGLKAGKQPLTLFVVEGNAEVSVGATDERKSLKTGTRITLEPNGELEAEAPGVAPAWAIEAEPSVIELEEGRQLSRFFKQDQPPLTSLVEAADSDRPEIRRLAYRGLAAIHQISLLIDGLNAEGEPETRQMAIAAMRGVFGEGTISEPAILEDLERLGDNPNWATTVLSLLRGIDPVAQKDPAVRAELLKNLESKDLAIRELALDNLREITQRGDNLGYDPDDPTEDGIRAWRAALLPDADAGKQSGRH